MCSFMKGSMHLFTVVIVQIFTCITSMNVVNLCTHMYDVPNMIHVVI